MDLTFYCGSDPTLLFHDERNNGIEAVPALLQKLESKGVNIRRIDPRPLTGEQRFHEYTKATIPAVYKKYEVKRIFGTNRHSACWFGVQVPALLVKHDDDEVGDTYPHRKSRNIVVTIHEFLTSTLGVLEKAA
ncbi:MAG: hypothetical protein IVW54_19090 [Candidatus Binataceae bacterium]|nr:hypothetical protein [Candidatus Binataceae bacterium]